MDIASINERIRRYFKQGQKNFDEFDQILLQVSLHVMSKQSNLGIGEEVERMADIEALFQRRASKKEFPAVKYLIYLQYSALMGKDEQLVDSLVRYGFDDLYPAEKLGWVDKITALEVASSLNVPYLQKLLDKVACDILFQEYDDLIKKGLNSTGILLQVMAIYHQHKYSRNELWVKLDQLLVNIYENEKEAAKDTPGRAILGKDNALILMKLLTERKMVSSASLWTCVQEDVESLISNEKVNLKELSVIYDCYYKAGVSTTEHNMKVADFLKA